MVVIPALFEGLHLNDLHDQHLHDQHNIYWSLFLKDELAKKMKIALDNDQCIV